MSFVLQPWQLLVAILIGWLKQRLFDWVDRHQRRDIDRLHAELVRLNLNLGEMGPGLLESAYEQSLAHELRRNRIAFELQHPQPVQYKEIRLDCGYRIDILVEDELILELKSVEQIKGIHEAQLLTYMKLADVKIGLLINFNDTKLRDGIKRFVL